MTDIDLEALRDDLAADFKAPEKLAGRSARDERIIAGFEDIQRFVDEHDRHPQQGEDRDIFERVYAVRLDRLRSLHECRAILKPLDRQGLLKDFTNTCGDENTAAIDLDALAQDLADDVAGSNITDLHHVRTIADKHAAEEIAKRDPCEDFETFRPLFEKVQHELDKDIRVSRVIRKDAGFLKTDIRQGEFFILGGQTLYVAKVGELIRAPNGENDARLRVIYSNGTESNLLLRSLQRAFYNDRASRIISKPLSASLFGDEAEGSDTTSGTIYVLRSKSENPAIADNREVLHKIGVTGGSVERRIANAQQDPTYLMADVEVVATYNLANINRAKFEGLVHKFFGAAQLDISIPDRFGKPVTPREWFLVPLFVIDEMIKRVLDGTISDYRYDVKSAKLIPA